MKRTKAQKEKLVKDVSRANDKAAIANKKKALKEARTNKRSAMKEARTACKIDREQTKESTRATYQRTVEKARAKRDAARAGARARCADGVQKVVNEYEPKIKDVSRRTKTSEGNQEYRIGEQRPREKAAEKNGGRTIARA
jgi:hypothetical protein